MIALNSFIKEESGRANFLLKNRSGPNRSSQSEVDLGQLLSSLKLFKENDEIMENQSKYVILARKYRPASFVDLKGQDALVRSVSGALFSQKLAHAFLLSGIRGIGKTTTARIMAKLMNCKNVTFANGVALSCENCDNCKSFNAHNHPDVLEIDAASKTGVDDIREIIENAAYMPLIGKYKIYIIDEVHMLSKNAFNALLKTLEEPPAHVKFIFATTEMHKIPATILSRCQNFSLKALGLLDLKNHLAEIAKKEDIQISDEALEILANESEGSVRDSLSLLDQVASIGGMISAEDVRNMIGYGSKLDIHELFEHVIMAETEKALEILNEIHRNGTDCGLILREMLTLTNQISKCKISNSYLKNALVPENEKANLQKFKENLEISTLSSIWQMLLKACQEMKIAPNKLMSAEMSIIRLCFMSNGPSLSQILKGINQNVNLKNSSNLDVAGLLNLLQEKNELVLIHHIKNSIYITEFSNNSFSYAITNDARLPEDFGQKMRDFFKDNLGENWKISKIEITEKQETITDAESRKKEKLKKELSENPLVRDFLKEFTGSNVKDVRIIN